MNYIEITLVGIALAMDCFTVSLSSGLAAKHWVYKPMALMVLLFGLFQGSMPLGSWWLSSIFTQWLEPIDHWIAFALLGYLGVNMIKECFQPKEEEHAHTLTTAYVMLMAIATSIDALAVGVSFTAMGVNTLTQVLIAVGIIALCSWIFSIVGLFLGIKIGHKIKWNTSPIGGVILLGIGIKILIEHLAQ